MKVIDKITKADLVKKKKRAKYDKNRRLAHHEAELKRGKKYRLAHTQERNKYHSEYYKTHSATRSKDSNQRVESINDNYVKKLISAKYGISRLNIPKYLIKSVRISIKIKRLLKTKKNENTKTC